MRVWACELADKVVNAVRAVETERKVEVYPLLLLLCVLHEANAFFRVVGWWYIG